MGHSCEFIFTRGDDIAVEILLEDMDITWSGDGWNEPETVTVNDFDIFWTTEGPPGYERVRYMNGGIVSSTCPVEPYDLERFEDECFKAAMEYAQTAEPPEPEPDYDYSY